jgi:hypothetical protein
VKRFFQVATLLSAFAFTASADISLVLVGGAGSLITAGTPVYGSDDGGVYNGDFLFRYTAELQAAEYIDNAGTSFFTVYDVPTVDIAFAPINWIVSYPTFGVTPPGLIVNGGPLTVQDQPGVRNVTFTYNGPEILAGGTSINLGFFDLISTSNVSRNDNYTSLTFQDAGDAAVQKLSNVELPGPSREDVPEPATMGLMGSALAGLALLARSRRK